MKERTQNVILLLFFAICSLQIAYSQQPTQEWVRRYSFDTNDTRGLNLKTDASKNLYVLSRTTTDSTFTDVGLLKYDPAGNLLWTAYYNSPSNRSELPVAFDVSPAGDVYITARSNFNFNDVILTLKYNSNGVLQWARNFNPGVSSGPTDLSIDRDGNVVVGANVALGNGNVYALVVKYNEAGDTIWTRQFNVYSTSNISDIVIGDSSNIYTTGYHKYSMTQSNFLVLKLSTSGNFQWYASYGVFPSGGSANSIAIDSIGFVYTVGTVSIPGGYDNVLLRIDKFGNILWSKNYTGINNNHGCSFTPTGLSVNSISNSIYYTTACNAPGSTQAVTLSYTTTGDTNWVKHQPLNFTGTPQYNPKDLILDKYNNLYVICGPITTTGRDYSTIKYLPDGAQQWLLNYTGFNTFEDFIGGIALDSSFIYVTGASRNVTNTRYEIATVKYNQPIGIIGNNNELPVRIELKQNYPNPFNSTTLLNYEIPKKGFVDVSLYNALGQNIRKIVNSEQSAGYYTYILNLNDLSSGIYFYSLSYNGILFKTKKMLLIK